MSQWIKILNVSKKTDIFRITNIEQPTPYNYLIYFENIPDNISVLSRVQMSTDFLTEVSDIILNTSPISKTFSYNVNFVYISLSVSFIGGGTLSTPIVTYDRINNVIVDNGIGQESDSLKITNVGKNICAANPTDCIKIDDVRRNMNINSNNTWDIGIQTTLDNQTFSLRIFGINPNINVDWGDGTLETFTDIGTKTRTYATAGNYTIRINGSFDSEGNIRLGFSAQERERVISTSEIPEILGITSFENSFTDTSLTFIPENLFANNTNVTNFAGAFLSCSLITSIPTGLFSNNTVATNFLNTFAFCTSLNSVPENLFANNILANNFESCFNNVSLTTTSYSNLLINLASNASNRPDNVSFDAGNSYYNLAGQTAKQVLQAKNWVFADLGLENIN